MGTASLSSLGGMQLSVTALDQLLALPQDRRDRVARGLREMVAMLEVRRPAIGVDQAWLQFTSARVRVLYSIEVRSGALIVHDIADRLAAVRAL